MSDCTTHLRKQSLLLLVSSLLLVLPGVTWAQEPEAEASPAKAHAEQASPSTKRPHIFSRSQWKYGLQRDDYLNRWIDRPLFVDPSLKAGPGETSSIRSLSLPSFQRTQEIVRLYGLDGLAFFPETSGRLTIYDLTTESGAKDFEILTEFSAKGNTPHSKEEVLRAALKNSASFRIKDKVVITSYGADTISPEDWKEILDGLKKNVGDGFLFVPNITQFGGRSLSDWIKQFHAGGISDEEMEGVKEGLRRWLRVGDGIYFASGMGVKTVERKFDEDFYRGFIIRAMKEVLAEPEFTGKLFGLSALAGHENVTKIGYTHSSDGTKTLRHSMEAALEAEPDLINIPEWDEQNENTSLRPTVYNGTSSMRIIRYYTTKNRGEELTPLPGDNLEIPNLIVSYRKLLTLGEKLEVELLNVPDSPKEASYTVQLALLNPQGREIYTSEPITFDQQKLEDHTVTIPSETLADSPVLIPRLLVEADGRKTVFSDGLHYIAIRPTWNWDYKWVKQPLRDLLHPTAVELAVSQARPDGTRLVTGKIEADEPLAYVEVLDNDDVVYSHQVDHAWWGNDDRVILSFYWQASAAGSKPASIKGDITLQNAEGQWRIPGNEYAAMVSGQTLRQLSASFNPQRTMVAIPRQAVDKAMLVVNFPGIYEGTIPVAKILKDSMFGIAGANDFSMVISHYFREPMVPSQLGAESAEFSVPILPDLPHSVYHLQAVGKSGRLYRSKPVEINPTAEDAPKKKITVYSDTEKQPVSVEVSEAEVPVIRYSLGGEHGTVLYTEAGRTLSGVLGDWTALVTERGGGQLGDGTPFFRTYVRGKKDIAPSAPQLIKTEDGEPAVRFDGKGNFITLPQGVIPRRAAFTITMDVRPEKSIGKALLLGNQASYPGSVAIYLENGRLKVGFLGEQGGSIGKKRTGLDLPAGRFSRVKICFDQKRILVSVDGKQGEPILVEGPGMYDTVTVIGGEDDAWFQGDIKNLEFQHGVACLETQEQKEN